MSTRIVSLALFRHGASAYEHPNTGPWAGRFFSRHLPAVVRAHHACFPGWKLRIHHDGAVERAFYFRTLRMLADQGLVELRHIGPAPSLCGAMLWRMLPAWDPSVERFICRDLDALPCPRDRRAVEEWISSDAAVHAIHDSMSHTGPLMGGMVGFHARRFREATGIASLQDLLQRAAALGLNLDSHGADQVLLNLEVWPRMAANSIVHQLKGNTPERRAALRPTKLTVPCPADVPPSVANSGDAYAPHIGAMFDHVAAAEFYDRAVQSPVMDAIAATEARTGEHATHVPPSEDRRVLFASNRSDDYAFYLPLSTRAWKDVAGYLPTIILVGTPEQWQERTATALALEQSVAYGAEVFHIEELEGHRDSTVAQLARLYAGALPIPDDCYVLTSDADMWPLSRAPYERSDPNKQIDLYYANAYDPEVKFPICFVGAKRWVWQQIMRLPQADGTLTGEVRLQLEHGLGRGADGHNSWNYDETLLGLRISEWKGWPAMANRINRRGGPPVDRIDRSVWNEPVDMRSVDGGPMMDAHLLRPGWHDDNWPRLRSLFARICPEQLPWADAYRAEYLAAVLAEGRR